MSKLSELEARLAALHAKTEAGFADRAAALCDAAARLDRGEEPARDEIKRLAHKLRGIAGSAGHQGLTDRAGRLEAAITAGASTMVVVEGARRLAKAAESAGAGAAAKPPAEAAPAATKAADALGWRVVALDDESSTRRLLEITLKTAGGCEAEVLEDPAQAMQRILAAPIDLVIVDAMMPDMDGLTFYRGVRERCGDRVPVVILSAASAEELGWCLPDDARLRWMRKPFRPGSLIAELRAFVEEAAAPG
ncbi:MAG: response regulator [Sandaracinaceae bacterium]|nr:response regulator [Sandaracinaceae bacterium]